MIIIGKGKGYRAKSIVLKYRRTESSTSPLLTELHAVWRSQSRTTDAVLSRSTSPSWGSLRVTPPPSSIHPSRHDQYLAHQIGSTGESFAIKLPSQRARASFYVFFLYSAASSRKLLGDTLCHNYAIFTLTILFTMDLVIFFLDTLSTPSLAPSSSDFQSGHLGGVSMLNYRSSYLPRFSRPLI